MLRIIGRDIKLADRLYGFRFNSAKVGASVPNAITLDNDQHLQLVMKQLAHSYTLQEFLATTQ